MILIYRAGASLSQCFTEPAGLQAVASLTDGAVSTCLEGEVSVTPQYTRRCSSTTCSGPPARFKRTLGRSAP